MKKRLIAVGMLTAAACHSVKDADTAVTAISKGDTITLPAGAPLLNSLQVSAVESLPYRQQVSTAGTIKAIPTRYAEIAPPFGGRVTRSYLQLGMKTSPETPLFEISSPEFFAAQKVFFQEKSQLQQAERAWKRQQDLVAHGVGTEKDLEEVRTAYEVENKEYENALMGIRLFKANPDQLSLGQPLIVRSPVVGEVIDNKVVLGQFLKDDAASIATIADLSEVWIAGQVKEKDIRFIHPGDECDITIVALPGTALKGKVYHVNAVVEEDTRSVPVLVAVSNPSHALKPGMYATVNFMAAPTPALQIPTTALLQGSESPYVFAVTPDGKYVKRTVVTGSTQGDRLVITSGLKEGDRIVTRGASFLLDIK
ncbi:efflux RND transporter periplasmic adaptor subunit [Chitinophaga eiseniae]|uniref:Efflux RND transporter periplasmic adaptor subunit n=1 Tax=Chitinophaga eiseniae TaxID=634771 RepID=A0A847SGH5_9BACT|nr:efflux RND transporter periplasmic adaptor subunit [Chitinophaga eiseniae]NLR78115.1 efflux RND transporter periplasmic adaptor subunit [Chitinophaga eiseniae]